MPGLHLPCLILHRTLEHQYRTSHELVLAPLQHNTLGIRLLHASELMIGQVFSPYAEAKGRAGCCCTRSYGRHKLPGFQLVMG